jgi:6-phosphogluconolactonase
MRVVAYFLEIEEKTMNIGRSFFSNRFASICRFGMLFLSCGAVVLMEETVMADDAQDGLLVYIGTYTQGESKGIYLTRFNPADGSLRPVTVAAETASPSFLAVHPNGKLLYAIREASENGGAVSSFTMNKQTGELTFLNEQFAGPKGGCHVSVDRTGQCVMVASYSGGFVSCLPILPDGRLGEMSCLIQHSGSSAHPRQQVPHVHGVHMDAANRFLMVPDLGLDKVLIYELDPAAAKLKAHDPAFVKTAPGAGPRHLAFHPNGRFAYVINEIDSTMVALNYDAQRGAFETAQTISTLPADFKGNSITAEVEVHPNGKFLYGSNRGHDSIVAYAIDPSSGKLNVIGFESTQGKAPRHFAIDPTGNYLLAANLDSSDIVVLRIDRETGKLQPTGHSIQVPTPTCVLMLPASSR